MFPLDSIASRDPLNIHETFLKRINDNLDRRAHCGASLAKRVPIEKRWRNLVKRYIDHEIRICLHIHSFGISGKNEGSDFCLTIEKTLGPNFNAFKSDA